MQIQLPDDGGCYALGTDTCSLAKAGRSLAPCGCSANRERRSLPRWPRTRRCRREPADERKVAPLTWSRVSDLFAGRRAALVCESVRGRAPYDGSADGNDGESRDRVAGATLTSIVWSKRPPADGANSARRPIDQGRACCGDRRRCVAVRRSPRARDQSRPPRPDANRPRRGGCGCRSHRPFGLTDSPVQCGWAGGSLALGTL